MDSEEIQRIVIEAVPSTDHSWVDILSALLVPMIAVVGVYIAYQQYRINQQRLRHETYERRLTVYKAIQRYLSEVIRDGATSYERALEFISEASEAAFLFDETVQERIDDIYKNSIRMEYLNRQLYPRDGSPGLPKGEERSKVASEEAELLKWHSDQLTETRPFFAKKLGLKVI